MVEKILLHSASSTSWFSLIMEIPEGSNMERSRDVDDAGRCSKQSRKRSYDAKKKRFAGSKPKQKRWSFPQEGTPVSVKKIVKRRKTSGVEEYRLLGVNILEDMVAWLSCSRMFWKITLVSGGGGGGRCYKKEGALLLIYIVCPFGYIKGVFAQSAHIKIRISKVTRPGQLSIKVIFRRKAWMVFALRTCGFGYAD